MKSSTNRALVAKKQSTFSAQVANNLLTVLQGYSKTIRLLLVMLLTLTASTAWGAKITTYSSIVTGKTYYIGATTGGTDYYLSVNGASTSTSIAGTAVTTKANATAFVFTGSGTSWKIKFADYANYLGLKDSKDNGKVQVVSSAATFTASNQSGKLRLSIGSYSIQKNNSGTQFGSYGNTQTDIWLEEASADPYTVKFYKTSTTFESVTETSAGAGVTPPTMEEECGEWEFQGWSESSSNSETSTTPLSLVTLTNGKYYPTEDIDLYPVYTKSEGGGGTSYTKVTTISEGVYVMVSEKTSGTYKYMQNTTSSGANPTLGSGITTSTTNGITSLTNEVTDAMLWDFTSTGTANQFYLRPHGSTTIGLGCTTSTGANIRISSTYKDVKWTITTSSSYGWQFKSNASSAMYLAVYSDSNWRNYTSSTTNQNGKFHLFKQTSSSTTYYYSYPDCGSTASTYTLTLHSGLSCVTDGSATVELNATELTNFIPATRDGFTCSGYWSAPSGGVKVLNADGTFAATSVQEYITDGKWTNEGNVTLTPRWECSNTMTLSVGTQSGGTYSLSKTSLETCDCTDANRQVTITATPNSGYSVTDISYSGDGTATKVSGPTVNGENTEWVYQFNQGDNGSGTFTVTFTTIPTYTITWMANGQEFHKQQDATHGTDLAVPSAPDPETYACDDKVFVGWTATPISGTTDDEPADLFTTKTAKVEEAATTYYAVFATADAGGSTTDTYDWESTSTGNWTVDAEITRTQSQGVDESYAGKINTNNTYVTYNNKVAVTNFSFQFKRTTTNSNYNVYIETSTDESNWSTVATYPMTDFGNGSYTSKSHTFDGTQDLYVRFHCYNTTATRYVDNVSITYGGTSYSDYVTTCAVIPDPEWGGAEIDNATISVNCGETSPMNSAATISFPADKNNTLTYDITVTASNGFLLSTNKTNDAGYGESVTVSPVKTGTNAGTITQKVYVRAVAPAQSDEEFNGTITISGKQITTQTINVTADVTCTQYTLTLVDRGVSTEQPTKYYAGETIDEAPADPEGVCTDPIHYVFDGWAAATVSEGSTEYTKVTFPYTVTGNTRFYAVYRYLDDGGEPSNDFIKVTSEKDDWTGDYVIVDEDAEKAIGNAYQNTNTLTAVAVAIQDNKVVSPSEAVIWQIRKHGENYTMYNASANKYAYIATNDSKGAGLSATTTNTTQDIQIVFNNGTAKVSGVDIYRCFYYYGSKTEWRTYSTGSYNTGALYCRSLESYLYTTSPICGPHLAITEGKDIYVTGGNAGGTRDLVIAQQKVSYKATRLKTQDGSPEGTAPDVKVATNGITKGGVVTTEVKVTFENTVKELQPDDTYTITGDIVVTYEADANNMQEDIQVQLAVDYPANADARDNFIVHARSLPSEFVIVAKSGDKWYALNADMSSSKAQPANGQVTLNDLNNPTEATYAPCNAIYTFEAMPQGAEDRKSVRFIGMENKYLWAASEGNNGVQNYSKAPAADALAYNWKLYTEDNITYHFGNAQNTRMLGLHSTNVAFGMYANGASVVQDIRILPYVKKCLYNYAPSNLKVSVLKGTYVTLTWDAVAGATKYQYSTNGTTWTDCGTEPTVTINGLTGATKYTYYIRAYHEDAGVSQECIDYAEITFTTANCDDVPTDITYSADMNSIIVSWIADAATSTVNLYSDEEAEVLVATQSVASPCTFTDLAKNTQYYVQVLADGTCASPIIPVKTEDVEVDIVEWMTGGIIVDINTDETIGVTLENEVSYGSGLGSLAEDLFFSKYFEGSGSLKMIAIYNGTGKDVNLSEYRIDRGSNGNATNISKTYDLSQLGVIKQGQEIIFYSWPLTSEDSYSCSQSFLDSKAQESGLDANPRWILCDAKTHSGIEFEAMDFSGDDPLLFYKGNTLIDVFGVSTAAERPSEKTLCDGRSDYSWSADEVTNMDYGKTTEDFPNGEIPYGVNVDDKTITAYTARVIMFRKNTVVSGKNAVTKNTTTFATFADEWEARQVCRSGDDGNLTCAAYQELGTFDYSKYYTKYESMGEGTTFDENARNADGTVTIPITDLYKYACSNIRVKLTNSSSEVLSDREYKVPIMITSTQGTDGQTFLALQENLATVEVDSEGNPTGNKTNLTLDEVREICKTCDVVVRDNATLTKVTDGTTNDHPQVHDVIVYEGASIVIPDGTNHNYTINSLSLRRKGDEVASAQVQGTGKFVLPADAPVTLSMRIDANNWHWFTLPYDCDIADVTWSDGTPAKYNTDWFLMYYDGESRAASTNPYDNHWKVYGGTTIEAGKGYIIGITGNLAHPNYTFELCFPMAQDVLTAEQTNKTVALNAWGVKSGNKPNNLGWNLVGNPYLNYYKTADEDEYSLAGLPLIEYTGIDPVTGDRLYNDNGDIPFLVTPIDGGWYEYRQELASEVNMMPFTAYFVQVGDPANPDHTDGKELNASFEASNRGKKSILRRAPSEVDDLEEPAIVAVSLTNAKGESDKTTLLIADRFTSEYEMNADFFKWFGDYYTYYTKPVLYTVGADQGKRAFNALNEELATQPVALGMYAAQAGEYTFTLNQKYDLSRVEEVWLYDATENVYTNLMQQDYTFSTTKVNGEGRFSLSVKMMPELSTEIENIKQGNIWATTRNNEIVVNGLSKGMQLWIYDATGKLLHSDRTTNYQHSYGIPQTGAYFIRVHNNNEAQTIAVVVE